MTWRGDISGVRHLAERVGDLARVPSRVAAQVSRELAEEIDAQFDSGEDPYGDTWAALADVTLAAGRTPPPLTDTGAMRGSVRVAPMRGSGVGVTVAHPAAPHQTGWSGPRSSGPARPILPDRRELPDAWQTIITEAVEREVRR